MPGSPPIRIIEPGTKPPPSTRFSSPLGNVILGTSLACISDTFTGVVDISDSRTGPVPDFFAETVSSTYVFHCPQTGHLPIHLGDSLPQLLQKYTDLVFVIALLPYFLRLRNSLTAIAVATPTFSDSDVVQSGGNDGICSLCVTYFSSLGDIPLPSLPIISNPESFRFAS